MNALILDLDGTLVDSFAGIHDALMHTKRSLGLAEHSLAETKAMVGHGLEVLLERALGPTRVAEGVAVYRARYSEIVEETTAPLHGAHELIAEANARGVRLALASNKPSYFSERILAKLGWLGHFSAVLGPDRVAAPKPHPSMLLEALRVLGVHAEETLYIGDMTVDLDTALAAGVPVALVASGNMSRETLAAAGAVSVFGDLSELGQWLKMRWANR